MDESDAGQSKFYVLLVALQELMAKLQRGELLMINQLAE